MPTLTQTLPPAVTFRYRLATFAALMRVGVLNWLAYRLSNFMQFLQFPIFIGVYSFLFEALYASLPEGERTLGGLDLAGTLTYVALVWTLDGIISNELDETLGEEMRKGQVGVFLSRPLSLLSFFFYQSIGQLGFRIVAYGIPLSLLANYAFALNAPATVFHGTLFAVSLLGSCCLLFFFNFLVGLSALFLEWNSGVRVMKVALVRGLGGLVVPLTILPVTVREGLLGTPFPYLYFVPVQIYLGARTIPELSTLLLIQWAWVLLFWGFAAALEFAALRRLNIQGG